MKIYLTSALLAVGAACAAGTCSASDEHLLSDRSRWSEDFTRFSPPTPECAGGSVEELKTSMSINGPHTLESFEEMAARSEQETPEPGTTVVFLYPLSGFVKERLKNHDRIHAFDFTTDPNSSPWWGFRGILVAHGDCIIHVEVTGYDHG